MAKRTRKNPYREKFVKDARIKIRNIVANACTSACVKLDDAMNAKDQKNAKAVTIYRAIKCVIQELADLGVFEKYEDVQDCLYRSLGITEVEEEEEQEEDDVGDASVIDDLKNL